MNFDRLGSRRLPLPLRLAAILIIAAAAIIIVGGLLGLPMFPTNIDNSRKSEVTGCYFIGDNLVANVARDRISFAGGSAPYDLISDKRGVAILPTILLRAGPSKGKLVAVEAHGAAEFLPVTVGNHADLTLVTAEGTPVSALKKPCG
jgi:hypothetical protein